MAEHPPIPDIDNPAVSHEESDVDLRRITYWGLGLAVVVVLTLTFLLWLFSRFNEREVRQGHASRAVPKSAPATESPRLQISPRADMDAMRAAEEKLLTSYAWVDKKKGVVRIPIERAMEIVAERAKQKSR